MEQPSGCIPERPGTGPARWSARLVLFLLAAGVLLLLGDGRASASSGSGSVAVSIETPRVAPARVARKLISTGTRAASRRPAGTHGRTAVQRRHSGATASVSALPARSLDQVAGRAGRQVGQVTRERAGRSLARALSGASRRVDATLAPVKRTLEPVLGSVPQPIGDVLDGPVGPVDLLPDLADRPPSLVPGSSPAPARAGAAQHSAHGRNPAAIGAVLVAGTGSPAGPLAAAERAALGSAAAEREPGAGKTAHTTGIPGIPASVQTTRDAPTGSLASVMLLLVLLLLWSVSFGKDGTQHRARPPLLFPA